MIKLIQDFLNVPSPTFKEEKALSFCMDWLESNCGNLRFLESNNSVIVMSNHKPSKPKPHIVLVGHSDVVPEFKRPEIKDGKLYGAGASDMKGAVGVFMHFLSQITDMQTQDHQFSLIIYAREEGTALEENGLYDLIQNFPSYFKTIDLALVGEPTNNTIQIGCVGSLHCKVRIEGLACHSARPWEGENALYKAVPVIEGLSKIERKKQSLFGVDFFDVIQITESHSEKGRTSVPGYWECNINYRFAPNHTVEEAKAYIDTTLQNLGLTTSQYEITDCVYPGKVIESELFKTVTETLGQPIQAKQAWTDVAQLTECGIPAFNFGPGRTDQAHKANEYIVVEDIHAYYKILQKL